LDWHASARAHDETPQAFFARVAVSDVKAGLADLESFTPAGATRDDYVDLGDTVPSCQR
jgi:hypothetical protein